jgi:hypothetical protein
MAVDCPKGFIIGQAVDEIVINGQVCHIEDTVVDGNVTITNSPDIDMIDVEVRGNVTVTGGANTNATLARVDSFSGDIDVSGHATAIVVGCIARGAGTAADNGNMVVNNNTAAVVYTNLAVGNLTCTGNTELDEYFNRVYGTENCQAQ